MLLSSENQEAKQEIEVGDRLSTRHHVYFSCRYNEHSFSACLAPTFLTTSH
eukprot:m.271048 g.271048  ORF g.271048 m.271048 type:complete len:51 (-) comp83848_c0_seq1:52-204(-)